MFRQGELPEDGWGVYRKTALAKAKKMDGPFEWLDDRRIRRWGVPSARWNPVDDDFDLNDLLGEAAGRVTFRYPDFDPVDLDEHLVFD